MSTSHPKIGISNKSTYISRFGVLKGYFIPSRKLIVSIIITEVILLDKYIILSKKLNKGQENTELSKKDIFPGDAGAMPVETKLVFIGPGMPET
jgi:hypothetical protein